MQNNNHRCSIHRPNAWSCFYSRRTGQKLYRVFICRSNAGDPIQKSSHLDKKYPEPMQLSWSELTTADHAICPVEEIGLYYPSGCT